MRSLFKAHSGPATLLALAGGAVLGQLPMWVGFALIAASVVWLSLSLKPVARALPRIAGRHEDGVSSLSVQWPARRANATKHLKRRRKHLRQALSDPAQRDWPDDAFRHAVEVHEDGVAADLARYTPQYAGRWIGQDRYSMANMPKTPAEFFVMRLTQAVALLDDVIEQLENRDRGVGPS